MTFEILSKEIQDLIKERGFEKPTLPQKLAIPLILEKKNVLVIAPVGSGKTESAMIPIFDRILKERPQPVSALYITPLKALNRDLLKRLLWWSRKLDIDISVRHGDTSTYERKMQVEFPPQLLIVTLETLQPILIGKKLREHLKNIKWVIIDEVHEVVDSKRGAQLAVALERLRELCKNFQLIMLSATVGEPKKVASFFAGGYDVEIVNAISPKMMKISVIHPSVSLQDRKNAEKLFCSPETAARVRKIIELIKSHASTLTFTNTREFAEILASRIKILDKDLPIEVHHSSLSKQVRITAEKKFKEGELKSIICTSSLQLGIDIGTLDFVIQYMSPREVTQLVQRIGRSGHEMEKTSEGVIVTTDEDDIFESAIIARRALSNELEKLRFYEKPLDVLAHQILGLSMEIRDLKKEEAYQIIKKSYPFRNLSYTEFLEVCKQLQQLGLIFLNDAIRRKKRGIDYYFSQLSTIPSVKQYKIFNVVDNSFVGVLDEEFVALHGVVGNNFIVKGEAWKIADVSEDKIFVEPTMDIEAAIPGWEGELIPVPYEVATEVGELRRKIKEFLEEGKEEELKNELKNSYPLDKNCIEKMVNLIKEQMKFGIVPDEKTILIEDWNNTVIIHSCFGSLVNETLGRFISAILTSRIGSVRLRSNPYRIILEMQVKNLELVKEALLTNPELLESYLEITLPKTNLFKWRFVNVAKRFGAIKRDAEYGKIGIDRIVESYAGTPLFKETFNELKTEKLDIEKAKEILRRIQAGEIKLVFSKGLSPLGRIGLRHEWAEVVGPEKPELEILKVFKKRLLNTKVRLVCLNCGGWDRVFVIKELPEDIRCSKCEARLLGIANWKNGKILNIVKKKLRNSPLNLKEKKEFERLRKTADLFLTYRKRAILVLAGRGIGPKTAVRILSKYHESEDELLKDIFKAERLFFRTKRYWKI